MRMIFLISFCIGTLIFGTVRINAQDCGGNEKYGKDNPDGKESLGNTNTYYLICDPDYTFDCCGVIDRWEYTAEVAGNVELQVWRPTGSGQNYRLVNSYSHTAPSDNDQDFVPTASNVVEDGDCIGWYSPGADVIGYKDGGNRVTARYLPAASVNTAGDVDWSGATTSAAYEWAIGAEVGTPADPVFTSSTTGTIGDTAAVNDVVEAVTYTDADVSDELTLSMTTNTYFDLTDNGDGTGSIIVKSSLAGQSGTQTLAITGTDLCGHATSQNVVITITNTPPTLTNLASSVSTSEDVPVEVLITTFTCTDNSGIFDATITEFPANVPAFFFTKLTGAATDEYGIYARSQADPSLGEFDYNTQRDYVITAECDDTIDSVTDTITVNLVQNTPPVINNLPATGTLVEVDVNTVNGTAIFTVDFTDAEGDTVDVGFTCSPASCPFYVLDSGDVVVIGPIADYLESAYDIFVTVADAKNSGVSRTLSVRITGLNAAPRFLNMDNTITVQEATAASVSVFTVSTADDDGDTLTLYWTESNGGTSYFDLDPSTGEVTTSTVIDYETLPSTPPFVFDVVVTDGVDSATSTLTVSIIDQNEPLSFTSSTYRTDVVEWTAVGTTLTNPGFIITDDDATDTYTCSMDCGTTYDGYYQMTTACDIRVTSLYKLDDGLPTTLTCTVTAEDTGGNTDTASLIINISYDNNFTPTFSNSMYGFSVDPYASAGTSIGTVTATDGDAVTYGSFSYTLNQAGLSATYFKIDGASGAISTLTSMSPCACEGTTFTVPVLATDTGGLVGTSTALITVTYTTTLAYDDRYKTFWDDTRNLVWFSILMILLAVTAVVTLLVCIKYICMKPCRMPLGRGNRSRFHWRPDREYRPPSPRRPKPPKVSYLQSVRHPPPPIVNQKWRNEGGQF